MRTPLNGILALAELLAASDLPKRERGWAEALKSAGDHLARLTTLVVDGARAQAHGLVLARETFGPRALAADIAASLSARAQANGLTAVVRIADDLPHQVVGDQVRLRSVLENLLDNAVKFTPRGRVGFTAAAASSNGLGVRLVFTVEDEGIGLSSARDRPPVPPVRAGERGDRPPLWRRRPGFESRARDCAGHGRRPHGPQHRRQGQRLPA